MSPRFRPLGREKPPTILLTIGVVAVALVAVHRLASTPSAGRDDMPTNTIAEMGAGRWTAPPAVLPGREGAIELEPVWVIGGADNDGFLSTRADGVAVGNGGEIYVTRSLERRVVRLGPDGRLLWQAGGRGNGPGEFSSISAIGVFEDTVFASDADLGRVSLFSAGGRFLATRRLAAELAMQSIGDGLFISGGSPVALLADGGAIAEPHIVGMPATPRAGMRRAHSRVPLLRIDSLGSVTHTVAWRDVAGAVVGMMRDGRVFQIQAPFEGRSKTAVMPNGQGVIVVRWTQPPEALVVVTRVEADGDTVLHRAFGYEPVPATRRAIERTLREASVFPSGEEAAPAGPEFEDALREDGLVPEVLPPVTGLAVGRDGSVWLRREDHGEDHVVWTVLSSTGQVREAVSLPRRQTVAAATRGFFLVIEEDAFGVPSLVRYDRQPASR